MRATLMNLNTLLSARGSTRDREGGSAAGGHSKLASTLQSPGTLWYDATVMSPSYQDSVGASSNNHWPDLVAASEDIIGGMHDRAKHQWQFPFGTTAN